MEQPPHNRATLSTVVLREGGGVEGKGEGKVSCSEDKLTQ